MTPLKYFHYLCRVHNYPCRLARVCVLMRFCSSKEELHYRLNRDRYFRFQ